MMHNPLGEYIAEFSRTHTQPIASYDLKTAAATAAALAKEHGWKVLAVMPRATYYQEKK